MDAHYDTHLNLPRRGGSAPHGTSIPTAARKLFSTPVELMPLPPPPQEPQCTETSDFYAAEFVTFQSIRRPAIDARHIARSAVNFSWLHFFSR